MAVTVADCALLMLPAIAEKVAVVAPAATVTEAGADKSVLSLESATVAPPVGAAEDSVTVHVEMALLARLVWLQPNDVSAAGGVRVKFAC